MGRRRATAQKEISFTPARVLLQDFTGVPASSISRRCATASRGSAAIPNRVNPLQPVELVIDHSVQVDYFGQAERVPAERRARVLAQPGALRVPALGPERVPQLPRRAARHRHRPPGQPRVPRARRRVGRQRRTAPVAYPDTLVGTDSHTTMVNGLGVVGWGVGGIEAEAAMLGQPISMLIPQVLGFRLTGAMPEGATATDLVLTITERLRKHGVVGKFVEFFGPGLAAPDDCRSRDARQHVSGVRRDDRDLPDRRDDARLPAADAAATRRASSSSRRTRRRRGCSGTPAIPIRCTRRRSSSISATVEPSLAGPKRPQDRVSLKQAKSGFPGGCSASMQAGGEEGAQRRATMRVARCVAEPPGACRRARPRRRSSSRRSRAARTRRTRA